MIIHYIYNKYFSKIYFLYLFIYKITYEYIYLYISNLYIYSFNLMTHCNKWEGLATLEQSLL